MTTTYTELFFTFIFTMRKIKFKFANCIYIVLQSPRNITQIQLFFVSFATFYIETLFNLIFCCMYIIKLEFTLNNFKRLILKHIFLYLRVVGLILTHKLTNNKLMIVEQN